MFEEIRTLVNEISNLPNIFVSQDTEYVLEELHGDKAKDYFRYFKFTIIKKGTSIAHHNVIYRASCKENNPESYLKLLIDDLNIIKSKIMEGKIY